MLGKIVPSIVVAFQGSIIEIVCYSTTRPYWMNQYHQKLSAQYIKHGGYNILIRGASEKNNGRYHCKGTKQRSEVFTSYADIFIGSKLQFIWM